MMTRYLHQQTFKLLKSTTDLLFNSVFPIHFRETDNNTQKLITHRDIASTTPKRKSTVAIENNIAGIIKSSCHHVCK